MNEPPDEKQDLEEGLRQMPPWMRVLMKCLVIPPMKVFIFLEGFIRTRWEIIPIDELPAARKRWSSSYLSPEQVREWINARGAFICPNCEMELKPERQEDEEVFPDVWEIKKYAYCEACAADQEHCCRMHHGYLLFREEGRWMAIFPRVPFLRRCWLRLRG
jgi:hypothetical protein